MQRRTIPTIILVLLVSANAVYAQAKNEVENIKNLCGCFEVTFQYAETFSTDTAYHAKKPYYAKGLEYVVMDKSSSNNNFVLQHLLVAYDTLVIKHWREDWQYQNQSLLEYSVNHTWTKKQLEAASVKNTWSQKVYEVNDAPRYEGVAYWSEQDGHPVWVSTVDAPLPRRDYTKRSDYNVLRRTNRIQVTSEKWIHEQDNYKIIRANGKDSLLVQEKGWNIYTRVSENRCEAAKKWWDEHAGFWTLVRKGWSDFIATNKSIRLTYGNNTSIFDQDLAELEKNYVGKTIPREAIQEKIKFMLAKSVSEKEGVAIK